MSKEKDSALQDEHDLLLAILLEAEIDALLANEDLPPELVKDLTEARSDLMWR